MGLYRLCLGRTAEGKTGYSLLMPMLSSMLSFLPEAQKFKPHKRNENVSQLMASGNEVKKTQNNCPIFISHSQKIYVSSGFKFAQLQHKLNILHENLYSPCSTVFQLSDWMAAVYDGRMKSIENCNTPKHTIYYSQRFIDISESIESINIVVCHVWNTNLVYQIWM